MYEIQLKDDSGKVVGKGYINPAAVASIIYIFKKKRADGRLNNGQPFSIYAKTEEDLQNFIDLVDAGGGGGGGGHDPSELPKPHPTRPEKFNGGVGFIGHLSDINENIEYIWAHTKDGNDIQLSPEDIKGIHDIDDETE